MKPQIKYTDEPIGKIKIVNDLLPSPESLVKKEKNIRITINLNKSSVDYFKQLAGSSDQKYQRVIRNLLDYYVVHQLGQATNKKKVK